MSYVLDLHGPSLAVDGACSSSLAAIHLARQSLLAGETDLVLAGGVNVIAAPAHTLSLGDSGALAADGHSKPFAEAADGYGRGEGAAVIVLRRLRDARRDGNRVHAVIRASAVRHDGRTAGIMAPNSAAQVELLRGVYANAGIDPATVSYLEAHATGTPLGDPTEVTAAATVFGQASGDPLLIGSVKGNVGHLEAVAGVAGVIKTILAMRHRVIPETVGPQTAVNPAILAEPGVRVVTRPTEWTSAGGPLRAGVSSFGFGGTIAHVCLEEGDGQPDTETDSGEPRVLVLSDSSPAALRESASRLATALAAGEPEPGLDAVARTLARHRSHLPHRAAVVAADREQAARRLSALAGDHEETGVTTGRAVQGDSVPLVWVFSGHGAQWAGMGRQLLTESSEFADMCATLEPIYRAEAGFRCSMRSRTTTSPE